MADCKDLDIDQGSTTTLTLRWENRDKVVYKPISALLSKAPARLSVPAHGLTTGWYAAVVGVSKAVGLNAESNPPRAHEYRQVTVVDAGTLEFNSVDGVTFGTVSPNTGYVRYFEPMPLAGCTAKMQVRSSRSATTTLLDLSTAAGSITVDAGLQTVSVAIPADIQWRTGVYDVEITTPAGKTVRLLEGRINVNREVTK